MRLAEAWSAVLLLNAAAVTGCGAQSTPPESDGDVDSDADSDTDADADADADGDADGDGAKDDGCSCRTPGAPTKSSPGGLGLLAAVALVLAARRRARR